MTFFYGHFNDVLQGLPRMSFMPLTLIFLYNFIYKKIQIEKVLNVYFVFSIIAALSILYQIYFGSLDFLVDSSQRGGLERFASTAGSLTAYGGAVGVMLILTLTFIRKISLKFIFFTLLTITAIASLSKAGLMNVLIALLFLIFFILYKYMVIL